MPAATTVGHRGVYPTFLDHLGDAGFGVGSADDPLGASHPGERVVARHDEQPQLGRPRRAGQLDQHRGQRLGRQPTVLAAHANDARGDEVDHDQLAGVVLAQCDQGRVGDGVVGVREGAQPRPRGGHPLADLLEPLWGAGRHVYGSLRGNHSRHFGRGDTPKGEDHGERVAGLEAEGITGTKSSH